MVMEVKKKDPRLPWYNREIEQSHGGAVDHYYFDTWVHFIKHIEGLPPSKKVAYRGQSNFGGDEHSVWDMKSAYNRSNGNHNFLSNKHLEYHYIQHYLKLYKTGAISFDPSTLSLGQILQFCQHYGLPTPLIDLTTDPLTALYFALSSIPSIESGKFGDDVQDRNMTIIELNLGWLERKDVFIFDMVELMNKDFDGNKEEYNKLKFMYTALHDNGNTTYAILEPDVSINPNLLLQKGIFVYHDSSKSLEEVIQEKMGFDGNKSPGIIRKYHIPYSSCFHNGNQDCNNVFAYLMHKRKMGIFLFENDMQGLKSDMTNGNFTYPLKCLNKPLTCECIDQLHKCDLKI